jgi:hypothetical protein
MSGRNDGLLYSGGSTSADRRRNAQRERLQEKEQKRSYLLPAADIVFAEIDKELVKIASQVLGYVTADTAAENLKATLLSLRMYDKSLRDLRVRIGNLLRESPVTTRRRERLANVTVAEGIELDD